ncbi:MAG: nucleotidyltransferase domain-containing protein [Candidatus Korarchaeota archaeon]|nr:nucleotidyltransferase domain-containing protein [Candidatus Korarchaeota archaeon]
MKEVARRIDPGAEVYLFGSVAEGTHTLSSDIDVLVVTTAEPAELLKELWLAGVGDPFEVHVQPHRMLKLYARRSRLIRV